MESTVLTIDGYRFVLRPTLRAAARLEQIYGGWQPLVEAFACYEIKALADIVIECSDDGEAAYDRLCAAIGSTSLKALYDLISEMVGNHLGRLIGLDPDASTEPTGPPASFIEYHDALFRIGTGWLGWTPEQTWNATPLEIIRAQTGFIEMQRALRGTSDDSEQSQSKELSKDEFKARSRQRIGQRIS